MINLKKYLFILAIFSILAGIGIYLMFIFSQKTMNEKIVVNYNQDIIELPKPNYDSNTSIETALKKRRSVRDYKNEPLSINEISQLLWAAQGITSSDGKRTAPSAGALYPLEIYLAAGNIEGFPANVYKYQPQEHRIKKIKEGDAREKLYDASFSQSSIKNSAAVIIISAVYERVTKKYGEKGIRYTHLEAGHAAQNIYLQSVSLNLGTVTIGGFEDEKIKDITGLEENEQPLYLMPVGKL